MAVYNGTRFDFTFEGVDSEFWRQMSAAFPNEMRRALRHAAYMTSMRMKAEMLQLVPGGRRIKDITSIQKWRVLDAYKNKYALAKKNGTLNSFLAKKGKVAYLSRGKGLAYGMGGTNWPIGGKLAQSIKYYCSKRGLYCMVGWLDKSSRRIGMMWEAGQRTRVTNRIRKMFAAAGIILNSHKTELYQPPRPVFKYFFDGRKDWMSGTLRRRFFRNVDESMGKLYSRNFRRYARSAAMWF